VKRRLARLGPILLVVGLALAVAVYALTGSFLYAAAFWAGPYGLALLIVVLLHGVASEKQAWERQEDERIQRRRMARDADPAAPSRGEFRRRHGLHRMGFFGAVVSALVAVGLVYVLSNMGVPIEGAIVVFVGVLLAFILATSTAGDVGHHRRRHGDDD